MSDDEDPHAAEEHVVAEIVPEEEMLTVEETRRRFVVSEITSFLAGQDGVSLDYMLEMFVAVYNWLADGVIPPRAEDPKSKFKVVKPDASGR